MTRQRRDTETLAASDCWFEIAADFALRCVQDGIPEDLHSIARLQAASYFAAVASGVAQPEIQAMATAWGIPSKLLQDPFKASADFSQRLELWCLGAMAYDFDDFVWLGHTSHSCVAAALVPLPKGYDGIGPNIAPETCIALGNEIGGRLAASAVLGNRNGQLWLHIHAPVAALILGLRLGLGRDTLVQAMALASAAPPAGLWPGFMGADSKAGLVVSQLQLAWKAVLLARAGFQSNTGILAGEGGVLDALTYCPLPGMLSGLGRAWLTRSLQIKPLAGCAYLQPVLGACEQARNAYQAARGEKMPVEEIAEVRVEASLLTVLMHELARQYGKDVAHAATVTFEVKWALAVMLDAGGFLPDVLQRSELQHRLAARQVLTEKMQVHHNGRYTAQFLAAFFGAVPLRVLVRDVGLLRLVRALRAVQKAHGDRQHKSNWQQIALGLGLRGVFRLFVDVVAGWLGSRFGNTGQGWYQPAVETFAFPARADIAILCRDGTVWEGSASTLGVAASSEDAADAVYAKLQTGWSSLQREASLDEIWRTAFSAEGSLAAFATDLRG